MSCILVSKHKKNFSSKLNVVGCQGNIKLSRSLIRFEPCPAQSQLAIIFLLFQISNNNGQFKCKPKDNCQIGQIDVVSHLRCCNCLEKNKLSCNPPDLANLFTIVECREFSSLQSFQKLASLQT